jgi:hypothetical protein
LYYKNTEKSQRVIAGLLHREEKRDKGLPGYGATGSQGHRDTGLQDHRTAGLKGCKIKGL